MKIYTSCFGSLKNIPDTIIPVSIARFPPKWFAGAEIRDLAPSKKLLGQARSGRIDQAEYTTRYFAEIRERYSPETLVRQLARDFDDRDVVLLCFEKKGEFCHRRLVAAWLEDQLGIVVPEW